MMISTRYDLSVKTADHIRALINRLARLDAAEKWEDDLNPAQIAALETRLAALEQEIRVNSTSTPAH